MHDNSLEAYKACIKSGTKKKRSQKVFEALWFGRLELSDRGVLGILFPGQ